MGKRIALWDNLKLFLIFLVVLGHLTLQYFCSSQMFCTVTMVIYTFHMPAFVFISGLFSKKAINGETPPVKRSFSFITVYLFVRVLNYLSNIIFEEVDNEMLKSVTLMEARVTSDLSMARVYYTYIGDYDRKEMAEELKKASPFLRSELAKRMDLRNTPELRFEFDESTLYGEHIDEILQEIHSENRE